MIFFFSFYLTENGRIKPVEKVIIFRNRIVLATFQAFGELSLRHCKVVAEGFFSILRLKLRHGDLLLAKFIPRRPA